MLERDGVLSVSLSQRPPQLRPEEEEKTGGEGAEWYWRERQVGREGGEVDDCAEGVRRETCDETDAHARACVKRRRGGGHVQSGA